MKEIIEGFHKKFPHHKIQTSIASDITVVPNVIPTVIIKAVIANETDVVVIAHASGLTDEIESVEDQAINRAIQFAEAR